MDFDSASRRLLEEQKARREAAKRRRESEAIAARRVEAQAEASRKLSAKRKEEAAEKARREDERVRKEAFMTGGIAWSATLRAVPIVADGDRVELPASALSALDDAIAPGRPLAFELLVSGRPPQDRVEDDDGYSFAPDATHAGVSSFSAKEGEIGLPPKTMLSLAKNAESAEALETGRALVSVRYVRLPAVAESTASLRPLSEGFFLGKEDEVDIDLKTVLEKELGRHTALTRGDLLAVDVEKGTVRLRVESLEPHRALCVLNTDLRVDVLPSEAVRAKDLEKQLVEDGRQALRAVRQARAAAAAAFVPSASRSPLRVLLRYRDGSRVEHKFDRGDSASRLADLVDVNLGDRLDPDVPDWILVATHPKRLVTRKDLESKTIVEAVGEDAVAFLVEPAPPEDRPAAAAKVDIFEESQLWERARTFAEAESARQNNRLVEAEEKGPEFDSKQQDREIAAAQMTGADRAVLFNELVDAGLERQEAADAAQRFGPQLVELDSMGMLRRDPHLALNFLRRYDGRMLRVVNALSDARIDAQDDDIAPTPPRVAKQQQQQQSEQKQEAVDPQKVLFPAIFRRLVADGASPNDAAARAIVLAANPRSLTLLSQHSGHVDNAVSAILLLS